MLIGLVTKTGLIRLVQRPEEEIANLAKLSPSYNYFFLTTDISSPEIAAKAQDGRPHFLSNCWCGGS